MKRPLPSSPAPIPLAMVGGGPGSFIGPVHRMAAELDGRFRLVAGAFSHDADRSRLTGRALGLSETRIHGDWRALIADEAERPDGARAVAIVTPNHLHLPIGQAALAAGLHVVSDKPATATLAEAIALQASVKATDAVYVLTYTYTGYEMIRHARALIASGAIGRVRKVVVDYPQGWLAAPAPDDNKQAAWRLDPRQAGQGGAIGDIGVHAFNLAEYVTGTRIEQLSADLGSVVPGRTLDDDCSMLLRFVNGARGVLMASQIATGDRNNLTLRVYGESAGLRWSHECATMLTIEHADGRTEILHAGMPGSAARLPAGHPEGFIEAFANIYADAADAMRGATDLVDARLPGIDAGVRSMRFVEQAIASSTARTWVMLEGEC